MAGRGKPGEQQIGCRLQNTADHQRRPHAKAGHQRAAREHANQRCRDAERLGHAGNFHPAETDLIIKRVGHRPGDCIAVFIQEHEQQDPDDALTTEQVGQRFDNGLA